MKTFKISKKMSKKLICMLSILLCISLIGLSVMMALQKSTDTFDKVAIQREVTLNKENIDVQSMLDSFDNVITSQDEETLVFEGTKKIDASLLKEIDNLSETQVEDLSDVSVRYHFKYNSDTNIITLSAEMEMSDGEISVDTIEGVGFINENNEIDAVMNVEGEGILLSEMQNAGMIENCGWFSNLIKKFAKVVVVAAVAVAAVAAVVATAGAAAPAVVAAGIGVTTTVVTTAAVTATAIAGYATLTAAIAAGVYITAAMVETIDWQGVRYQTRELTDTVRYQIRNNSFFLAVATGDGRMFITTLPVSDFVAMTATRVGLSAYTYYPNNALNLAITVNYGMYPTYHPAHGKGLGYFDHYHVYKANQTAHIFYGAPIL